MKRTFSVILGLALASASMVATADVSYAKSKKQTCKAYAKKQADHRMNQSVGKGLAAGGAGGAAIGLMSNGKKGLLPGLAIGAFAGTLLGAANAHEMKDQYYWTAYEDCMENY